MEHVIFMTMVDAIGNDATEKQAQFVVDYIIENIAYDYWLAAAEYAILIPGVYTQISMRYAENGGQFQL